MTAHIYRFFWYFLALSCFFSCKKTPVPTLEPYAPPFAVELDTSGQVPILTWDEAPFVDFDSYIVVHSLEPISDDINQPTAFVRTIIRERKTTTFTDFDFTLNKNAFYRVFVKKTNGDYHYSTQVQYTTSFTGFDFEVERAVLSLDKKSLVIIEKASRKLIRYRLPNLEIEAEGVYQGVHVASPLYFADLGAGEELFGLSNTTKLSIYDPMTLVLKEEVQVPYLAYNIASNQKNDLYLAGSNRTSVYDRLSFEHKERIYTGTGSGTKHIAYLPAEHALIEQNLQQFARINFDTAGNSTEVLRASRNTQSFGRFESFPFSLASGDFIYDFEGHRMSKNFDEQTPVPIDFTKGALVNLQYSENGARLLVILKENNLAQYLVYDTNTWEVLSSSTLFPCNTYIILPTSTHFYVIGSGVQTGSATQKISFFFEIK